MIENHIAAEKDYVDGMKYKDLADKYEVSINTVKSWKQRYAWERTKGAHKQKGMHTNKGGAPPSEEPVIAIDNDGLTDKQILFVSYYLKCWNATKAYQKAYDCAYTTARNEGARLLANPCIKEAVVKARDEIFAESYLSSQAIIQKYMDIAFADMTEFIDFTQVTAEAVETTVEYHPDGSKKSEKTETVPYTYTKFALHHSEKIDGTLVTELSKGKDGMFKVKLTDRMKALDKLEKYMGMMTEEEQQRVKKLKGEVALLEQKATNDDDKAIEIVIKRKVIGDD